MKCATTGCPAPTSGKSKYCHEHKKEARAAWLEKVNASNEERERRYAEFQALFDKASSAGAEQAQACVPTPMVVEQHENMTDDGSPVVKKWHVPGGACGFAWVIVRPGTSSFARWLVKNGHGGKAYYGGITVNCPLSTQSIEIKEAYCRAFAEVLSEHGIKAYANSRLD